MKKIYILVSIIICLGFHITTSYAQLSEYLIDFNTFTAGNLGTQGGWKSVATGSGSPTKDFDIAYIGINTMFPTPDNSLACFYNYAGANVGRNAYRKTTPEWPFEFGIGGVAELQVDALTNYWGFSLGFYYDSDNNGKLNGTLDGGLGFGCSQYSMNNGGKAVTLNLPNGTNIKCTYDNAPGWSRYKLVIDFEANNGAGALSLYAKKTDQATYQLLPEANNINIGLTPGSGTKTDPAKWKTFIWHSETDGSAFDNLYFRQPNTGGLLYQYLTFDNHPLFHLTTDAPFNVHAFSNRGLPATYTIEGPATISGETITLTGEPGIVTVTAHQSGNSTVAPAADLPMSFEVIDPLTLIPTIEIKNPVNTIINPSLDWIPLSFKVTYPHHDLIHLTDLKFTLNSTDILTADSTDNGFYIAYWKPPKHTTHNMMVTVTTSGGVIKSESLDFEVVSEVPDILFTLMENQPGGNMDSMIIFPSHVGVYNKVMAYVYYNCPCDPWDRIGSVNVEGSNGFATELLRYITPYGVPCRDSVDVTDLMSQFQGKVRVTSWFAWPASVTVKLKYYKGTPEYKYSWVSRMWKGEYVFGNWTPNGPFQPCDIKAVDLTQKNTVPTQSALLRITTSGHGWGSGNTGNAAEFYNTSHNIKVNGETEYTQHLWQDCSPNPVGCQPQDGTWFYDRAGWCPGSIPMLWRYDFSSSVNKIISLQYEFDPYYINHCSGGDPNCVSGVTCEKCNTGSPPVLNIAADMITYFNSPPYTGTGEITDYDLQVFPNPSNGRFTIISGKMNNREYLVSIHTITGKVVKELQCTGEKTEIDVSYLPQGLYLLRVQSNKGVQSKKIIID